MYSEGKQYSKVLRPGINFDLIDIFIMNEKSKRIGGSKKQYVLSFDGKLIRPRFTKDSGDVDMFGCERQPTLSQRKCRLDEEQVRLNEVITSVHNLQPFAKITSLDFDFLGHLLVKIRIILKLLTVRIKEIRQLKLSKS